MTTSVLCTMTLPQAERIISELRLAEFSGNEISILLGDKDRTNDFSLESITKPQEVAVTGVGTGALLGGALGWLAGIGALAIPGLGPFIAAGPLMATLSGAAIVGTLGGVAGGLVAMGMPEFQAKRFEGKVRTGSCLISIRCDNNNEIHRAQEICEQCGAKDVTSAGVVSITNIS